MPLSRPPFQHPMTPRSTDGSLASRHGARGDGLHRDPPLCRRGALLPLLSLLSPSRSSSCPGSTTPPSPPQCQADLRSCWLATRRSSWSGMVRRCPQRSSWPSTRSARIRGRLEPPPPAPTSTAWSARATTSPRTPCGSPTCTTSTSAGSMARPGESWPKTLMRRAEDAIIVEKVRGSLSIWGSATTRARRAVRVDQV